MHKYVLALKEKRKNNSITNKEEKQQELFVGHVIQAALSAGMQIDTVIFQNSNCYDIGTPEDLAEATTAVMRM